MSHRSSGFCPLTSHWHLLADPFNRNWGNSDNPMRPTLRVLPVIFAAVMLGSCGGDSTAPAIPTEISKAAGDAQSGSSLVSEPESLAVKVLDKNDSPVQGVVITWASTLGGGSLSPSSSVTNEVGLAKSLWTLGPSPAGSIQKATASLPSGDSVEFTATSFISPDVIVQKISGDNQTATVGNLLPDSIFVVVKLPSGAGVPNARVSFTAHNSGAVPYPYEAITDANGRAGALWGLGVYAGTDSLTVSLWPGNFQNFQPTKQVTFTATALPGPPRAIFAYPCCATYSAAVGSPVPDSMAVIVYDGSRNLVSDGVQVEWTPIWGSVRPMVSTTINGIAKTQWTLGSLVPGHDRNNNYSIGSQFLHASVAGVSQSVRIGAVATSPMTEDFTPSPDTLAGTHFGGGCFFSSSCRDTLYIVVAATSPNGPVTDVTAGLQTTPWGIGPGGAKPPDSFEFVPPTNPLRLVYSNGAWRGQISAQNFDFSLFIYILATATDAAGNRVTVPYQAN